MLVSPVGVAEIYTGAFPRQHTVIEAFFGLCQGTDIEHVTARTAGFYADASGNSHQGLRRA